MTSVLNNHTAQGRLLKFGLIEDDIYVHFELLKQEEIDCEDY